MRFIRLSQVKKYITGPTVSMIGTFDGFHLGHQTLLKRLKYWANNLKLPSLVILFEPQPSEYFLKNEAPARLMSLREKLIYLQSQNIDYVCCLPFNKKLACLTAEQFAEQYLINLFYSKKIVLGRDFRFGAGRKGDADLLTTLGKHHDFSVEIVPDQYIDDERISSTHIRSALNSGNLSLATACLGHYYSVSGSVVHGDKLARKFGVPTANIHLKHRNLALRGIFQVKVEYQGKYYNGIASVGMRPTTHEASKLTLEVHLFDCNPDLYGKRLEVIFFKKIRDEQRFDNIDLLVEQIHKDVAMVRLLCEEL